VRFVDNGDGTATLSGKPGNGLGQVGDYNLTFTASNGVAPNATQNFTNGYATASYHQRQ
jgi:hypothetical protein